MYHIIVDLLKPPFVLFLLTALGLTNLWRCRRETRPRLLLATLPFAGLLAVFTPAVSALARGSLEWWYPPNYSRPAEIDAIVVLGGHIIPPSENQPISHLGYDSLRRCLHAADLYHQGPPCPMIVTGGKVDWTKPGPTIAEKMSEFLVTQGIPATDLQIEAKSSTTYENAVQTRKLLDRLSARRILIVTDAVHLPRAALCFQTQGFEVQVSACDYSDWEWSLSDFLPHIGAAWDVERTAHEWLGITYYWICGRI